MSVFDEKRKMKMKKVQSVCMKLLCISGSNLIEDNITYVTEFKQIRKVTKN